MNRLLVAVTMMPAAIALVGCASVTSVRSSLTAYTDPDFRGRTFAHLCVLGNYGNLQHRATVEGAMITALADSGIGATQGMDLFPPTRKFRTEEKLQLLAQGSYDAYLVVATVGQGPDKEYVPLRAHASHHVVTTTGGYETTTGHWANFNVTLYDVATGNAAWIGQAKVDEKYHATLADMVGTLSRQVVEQLCTDHLLVPVHRQ